MKRVVVVGIVGGIAVLALAATGVWWFTSRPPTAQAAAETYLRALETGDFAVIAGLRGGELGADAESLLRDAFAGAASYVSDPEILEVRIDDDSLAAVHAEALLGDDRRTLNFTMRDGGDGWELTGDHLGVLQAETMLASAPAGDSVWVGGALAPAAAELRLLPAVYEVQAAPRGILAGTATAAVGTDEPIAVTMDAALSPGATALAQAQVDAYAEACAAATASVPDNCGLRVPWAADLAALDSIAFRIDKRPAVSLHDNAAGFDATGGVIVATASGTTRGGESASFTYRADEWALRGSIRFSGDDMILAVR
ncbi:hypothetical protein MK786_15930 [Microbacterium sp. CFH 31415]|uniref:hypothetical protein n=1 Tax=Microbacterium sp. CFH 31415 TaxID=2921732 RepID=UPI001F13B974|nr:hypothetical protein [Microbacterium sp. CFH 31415]MCH6232243.1 hypothetical protein [Microbacterium sp. CFH 31415]